MSEASDEARDPEQADQGRAASTGAGSFTVPSGERLPCSYDCQLGIGYTIQVDSEHAAALTGGTDVRRFFRGLGFGVVRKDLSTPLELSGDKVWIDDPFTARRLSLRVAGGTVEFELGTHVPDGGANAWFAKVGQPSLEDGMRGLFADGWPVQVIVCVGGHVLPRPIEPQRFFAQYQLDQAEHRLWGGLRGSEFLSAPKCRSVRKIRYVRILGEQHGSMRGAFRSIEMGARP